ncbi:MAG: general secretion pathway protein E [Myxococcota bacterium]|jgi:general secretion pathway protein E
MSAGYTVDYLLDVLVDRKVVAPEQSGELRVKAPAMTTRLRHAQRDRGFGMDITPAEVVAAFGIRAVDGRLLDEDRVMQELAAALGYPYKKIDSLKIDHGLVTTSLPRRFAKKYVVLPLEREGRVLTVAVDNPFNLKLVDDLRATTSMEARLVLASKSDILRTITEIFGFRSSVSRAAQTLGADYDLGNLERLVTLSSEDEIEASDRHIVNAVEYLLRYAFDQGASDIHIEPKREHSLVRMRIDGVLHAVHKMPKTVHPAVTSRIKTMGRLDIAEKRRPQDGRLKTDWGDREVEIRISTMPVAFGEKVVLRVFDPEILMQSLDDLGLHTKELALFQSFVERPHGIILVTGPTGSGKTTTLYSALKHRATEEVNCTTIEDPIEMVIEEFNQTEVNVKVGITFAAALRTVLRQDPDIIMVGEVRDSETAQYAVQAALTGHLVMTTLHTNDTAGSISRMVDLGVEPFLLGSSLTAIVAQRLLRKVCSGCRTTRLLNRDQLRVLNMVMPNGDIPEISAAMGTGCHICRGTGLKGRIGIYEILPVTDEIRALINEQADGPKIMRAARDHGMQTLREAAIRKMVEGMTSFEEVLRVTSAASE